MKNGEGGREEGREETASLRDRWQNSLNQSSHGQGGWWDAIVHWGAHSLHKALSWSGGGQARVAGRRARGTAEGPCLQGQHLLLLGAISWCARRTAWKRRRHLAAALGASRDKGTRRPMHTGLGSSHREEQAISGHGVRPWWQHCTTLIAAAAAAAGGSCAVCPMCGCGFAIGDTDLALVCGARAPARGSADAVVRSSLPNNSHHPSLQLKPSPPSPPSHPTTHACRFTTTCRACRARWS